jgi:hypothetical protein
MEPLPKWLQRGATILGIAVAATTLVTFILDYSTTKGDLDRANRELVAEKERNRRAFELLKNSTSEGRIAQADLVKYLSEDDAAQIVRGAGIQITASLPFPLETQFFPSGWMGDGESGTTFISLARKPMPVNGESKIVVEIHYRKGPKGGAGIYWQYPDGNWGDQPGKSLVGARAISFSARGDRGGELVELKSDGIRGKRYQDSFEKSLGVVVLDQRWKQYMIDLSQADLSSVIGAFAWSASAADNQGNLRFYLADLEVR